MVVKGIRVPVGFPGEQRNISLIDGSASIALLIWSNNQEDQNFSMYRKLS
jgi:hypothetical protein